MRLQRADRRGQGPGAGGACCVLGPEHTVFRALDADREVWAVAVPPSALLLGLRALVRRGTRGLAVLLGVSHLGALAPLALLALLGSGLEPVAWAWLLGSAGLLVLVSLAVALRGLLSGRQHLARVQLSQQGLVLDHLRWARVPPGSSLLLSAPGRSCWSIPWEELHDASLGAQIVLRTERGTRWLPGFPPLASRQLQRRITEILARRGVHSPSPAVAAVHRDAVQALVQQAPGG